jgi:hypothetical protein
MFIRSVKPACTALLLAWGLVAGAVAQTSRCDAEPVARSLHAQHATEVVFKNNNTHAVRIWWLNYTGKRVWYQTLAPGESYTQSTYLTHPWIATDKQGRCVGLYYPDAKPRTIDIQ